MNRAARLLAFGLAVVISGNLQAQQASDPRVADIVKAGKVRVGLGVIAPHWAVKDPATGELRGVAVDLARSFAERLGVQLVTVEYPSPTMVVEGAKQGAWDVGFVGVDPSRAATVDFSPPYLQVDATYLLPAGSTIRDIAEADQPGVRIAVSRNGVEDIVLTRTLKRAELIRVDTLPVGFELLRAGKADVLATPRPTALQFAAKLPGSRVLADRFNATRAAMVVPKGEAARLAYVSEFIEEAKASGLIEKAIERSGALGVQALVPGSASVGR